MARRSILFSPGDQPDLLRKAPDAGADVVVMDLEDGVAPGEKDAGRACVNEVLADPGFDPDCEVCLRVNPDMTTADDDLAGALAGGATVDSVMLPKPDSAGAVEDLASLLDEHDVDAPVLALCESAAGVLHAEEIAAAEPVDAVAIGAEDLAADVGASRSEEGIEVLHAREHVVLAAAAAGVDAVDTVFTDIEDTDRLAEETAFARDLGFDGKMAIHPAQVSVVNEAFTPTAEQIEWARRVLDAAEGAAAEGRGVFRVDGEMIDAPLVARAEDIVERAETAGK